MTGQPAISFCVCTADRRPELERCLESFARHGGHTEEVIVSDDSRDPGPAADLCARFPFVQYVRGPRRGLSANRNAALKATRANWLSFLDDDAMLGPDFVRVARQLAQTAAPGIVFTGYTDEYGRFVRSSNMRFLGFFGPPPRERLETVNINSCLFPRAAFRQAAFDETLVYGYDEMDISYHLLSLGYEIVYDPRLMNFHLSPPQRPEAVEERERVSELARFYMNLKRYAVWQRRPGHAAAFAVIAAAHQVLHHLKRRRPSSAARVPLHMARAIVLLGRNRRALAAGEAIVGALAE